jgi:hypothetical protein
VADETRRWVKTSREALLYGNWVVGGFQAEDGTIIPNDDIIDSSDGAPRQG